MLLAEFDWKHVVAAGRSFALLQFENAAWAPIWAAFWVLHRIQLKA